MKYYLVVGEASGDLHASCLMRAIKKCDTEAQFRYFGGDKMNAVGGTLVKHYKYLAYMGFIPVLLHLRTILKNLSFCKRDIKEWNPDVVILVDYPGFNLKIAKFVHSHTSIPVFYYIAPKLWAWKEYRIKNIKRDVDEVFSILPFEVDFFEGKHKCPIQYVGNPTADEVKEYLDGYNETTREFCERHGLDSNKKIIAILPGSRIQEIKDNLKTMLSSASMVDTSEYQVVVAGMTQLREMYGEEIMSHNIIYDDTYALLAHSTAALVTSGTATLETCLFNVPQVVCYKTPLPRIARFVFNHIIKCRFISLVNLIADKEVVPEMMCERFSAEQIKAELFSILPGGCNREQMLSGYKLVHERLGNNKTSDNAAYQMVSRLQ